MIALAKGKRRTHQGKRKSPTESRPKPLECESPTVQLQPPMSLSISWLKVRVRGPEECRKALLPEVVNRVAQAIRQRVLTSLKAGEMTLAKAEEHLEDMLWDPRGEVLRDEPNPRSVRYALARLGPAQRDKLDIRMSGPFTVKM